MADRVWRRSGQVGSVTSSVSFHVSTKGERRSLEETGPLVREGPCGFRDRRIRDGGDMIESVVGPTDTEGVDRSKGERPCDIRKVP